MANEIRVQPQRLVEVISGALSGLGVPQEIRNIEAQVMAEADLLGVPSHGVRMLPELMRGIRDGRVTANPQTKIIHDHHAACTLDGDNGPGRFVSMQAMQHAIDRASRFGLGACSVTRVTHWGRAHAYACHAARAGMIGICTTNAIPNMLAWGSIRPLLANNPLGIAVPRAAGREPLVLDIAMSQAAVGKIATFQREGKKAPANWGLDASGNPSDDPAAILASGKLLPFGDHKGAGLGFMMELFASALSGGKFSFEIVNSDKTGLDPDGGKFFLAIDVRAFAGGDRFARRVEEFVTHLKNSEPGMTVTLPGERGWETGRQNLANGIPIHPEIITQLRDAGVNLQAGHDR